MTKRLLLSMLAVCTISHSATIFRVFNLTNKAAAVEIPYLFSTFCGKPETFKIDPYQYHQFSASACTPRYGSITVNGQPSTQIKKETFPQANTVWKSFVIEQSPLPGQTLFFTMQDGKWVWSFLSQLATYKNENAIKKALQ